MTYRQTISISKADYDDAMRVLATVDLGGVDDDHLLTANFPDGRSMDIQGICYGKEGSWVEAALYEKDKDGWEYINGSDASNSYEGLWTVTDWWNHDGKIVYETEVIIV